MDPWRLCRQRARQQTLYHHKPTHSHHEAMTIVQAVQGGAQVVISHHSPYSREREREAIGALFLTRGWGRCCLDELQRANEIGKILMHRHRSTLNLQCVE